MLPRACGILSYMERKPTYIRAWRKERGYTLDDMVGRLDALGVTITGASLSRIERNEQPYSQDILEAIAEALNVSREDLLGNDPTVPEAKVYDFLHHLDEREAKQAVTVLKAMFGERA